MMNSVAVWLIPERDFKEWTLICGPDEGFSSYSKYLDHIDMIFERAIERRDSISILHMSVREMMCELYFSGIKNTARNRQSIVVKHGIEFDSQAIARTVARRL